MTRPQIIPKRDGLVSAVALAAPRKLPALGASAFDHRKATALFASHVDLRFAAHDVIAVRLASVPAP